LPGTQGHDLAIALSAEAGQLEVNVMMPYVAYALLESLDILTHAVETFDEKCIRLIEAHEDRPREYAERTVGLAATLNEKLGFMGAAEVAERAVETGQTIPEIMKERGEEGG
jgi:aspartate ammonia-lyase